MPHDDKLLVILHTDIICILSVICEANALKLIRHYEPLKAREKFLRKSNNKIEMLNYVCDESSMADDDDKIIKSVIQDYQNGIITDVSFHSNGYAFCVTFLDNTIMLCSAMLWDVRRVFAYPDFHIKQCQFISYWNGNNNISSNNYNSSNVLLTLTSNNDQMMLTSLSDLNSRMLIDMHNVVSFVLSTNGKLLINLHHSGDLLVYNLENHLSALNKKIVTDTKVNHNAFNDEQKNNREGLVDIQMKMKKAMPKARLLPILKEFGEYPEKFRPIMWKTLLKLPENCESFAILLKKDLYPSVRVCMSNYDKRPSSLDDQKTLNNLKHIMSCLFHWSKVFENVAYLAKFIFPFVKLSKGDLIFSFELIATLMLNHCQLWFEFLPLQMPYNYLNLIENVLMEMDHKLYEFYKSKDITSEHYALPLMQSAFSEVLDEQTWPQLWDHIVSNEPCFLIFIIVAYNSIHRSMIMKMKDIDNIVTIFHEQNCINFKKLMKKSYTFMRKCPLNIHPKQYMASFTPLSHGMYQKFEHYQKNLINVDVTELNTLREEQKVLDCKLAELDKYEKSIDARLESFLIDEEYQKRMKEIESQYEKALDEEEQRIIYQRKLLLLNTRKTYEKEIESLIQIKNTFLQNQIGASKKDLELMLNKYEKQRIREDIEMQMTEENLKLKEIAVQMKALNVRDNSRKHVSLDETYKDSVEKLEEQHKKFMDELSQLETFTPPYHNSETETSITTTTSSQNSSHSEIDVVERALYEIQDEFNNLVGKDGNKADYKWNMKKLEGEVEKLEHEINFLLADLKAY
ncbi:unnamed protein product [Chironomus riparius]|uniref:Rab-GAP TBC domain-containing protein n=1 Tax=Chironomus riparius TaxID=315576 RepID=A0A9N9WSW2_9DIPT|nr:unnamed protein product [Chironomus riparius]